MKTVIFSDVHLTTVNEAGRQRMAILVSFLRSIDPKECNRLIVLGDLFDFWFEYKHVIFSMYFDVLRALADLKDAGVEMHFVPGNHDFWAGRFLREQLCFAIHSTPPVLDFGGKRVLLVHGDGINATDYGYRIYKTIARFPIVVWLFGLLHPDWAMSLGNFVSGGSRHMFQTKDASQGPEARALREFAKKSLAAGRADVVVCGHAHFPVMEEHHALNGMGTYINSGDWLTHYSFVEWDAQNGFRLLEYSPLGKK
jgi:UDP-2,3-diacylglucosamine hydrolase